MNWYILMLDLLSFSFICFLIIFTLIFRTKFSPQVIGIILTYCDQLQEELVRFLVCRSNLENDMVALERCLAYTKIMSEKPNTLPIDETLENWPSKEKYHLKTFQ